jgi:hypothetical protein
MARGDGKTDQRAKIGVEGLEGRDLPSSLVAGAAASAPLIRPPAASASAYHTTVWGRTGEGLGTLEDEDGFGRIKVGSATAEGEFLTIKGESALSEGESRKSTPILF